MKTLVITPDEMEQFIGASYGDDIKTGKYIGWTMHDIDQSTGQFDSEKGAMYDYELVIEDPEGNLYKSIDGYYTGPTGHVFSHSVTFESYIPSISFTEWIEQLPVQTLTEELKREIIEYHYRNE